jgi:hypothetical protein
VVHFCPAGFGSESTDLIESGSKTLIKKRQILLPATKIVYILLFFNFSDLISELELRIHPALKKVPVLMIQEPIAGAGG